MNRNEKILFNICKTGDLGKLKNLLEKEDLQLNVRDRWDSTPLYYACLCGHSEVVEYLLANGAKCEANTFDGERCLYGALTDQIRNIIKNYKVVQTKRDQYEQSFERLFELGAFSDIVFEIKGRVFRAHKCILACRSEYFRRKFENKWKKRTWIIGRHEELVPEAFESVLNYIYTGRFSTLKIHFSHCVRLAKLFELQHLIRLFEHKLFKLSSILMNHDNEKPDAKLTDDSKDPSQNEETPIDDIDIFLIGKFGINSKLSNTITIEPDYEVDPATNLPKPSQLSMNLKFLAKSCIPKSEGEEKDDNELQAIVLNTHDLCITIDEQEKFLVHKAFMVERCEYFKTFLNDPFHEIQEEKLEAENIVKSNKHVSQINLKQISKEVLTEIIYFIYSNQFSTEQLDENLVYDILVTADLYLLPNLKRKCAQELIDKYISKDNLFDLLQLSRVYDLKKLEYACINFLALNLEDFEESDKLREMIVSDASQLKMRQETDSIDIIDDLRYKINEQTTSLLNNIVVNEKDTSFSAYYLEADELEKLTSDMSQLLNSKKTSAKNAMFKKLLVERDRKLNIINRILRELNLEC